jgi:hypothetical protein
MTFTGVSIKNKSRLSVRTSTEDLEEKCSMIEQKLEKISNNENLVVIF